MGLTCRVFVMMLALTIPALAYGVIIELPSDYDPSSPWTHLAKLNLTNLTETDCQRTCIAGDTQRVCLYTFVLEHYAAMGTACGDCAQGVLEDCFQSQCVPADGKERGVMSINRMIPGPAIHVCKNDVLVINVINKMEGTGSTLHWHGILQKNSPWMDGVPFVTQCPIHGGNSFRYVFTVDEAGTEFYHSHTRLHRTNGQYGALIVREPETEELWDTDTYDYDLFEHTLLISDWIHYTAEMFFPGLPTLGPGALPNTFLINGLGKFLSGLDGEEFLNVSHPMATFHVKRDKSYRFRIINANSFMCPVLIQIEGHNMTLIATDGKPIKPVVVDGLVSFAGERFDVVIDTHNTTNKNASWIHFRGLGRICEAIYKLHQYAVLSYDTDNSQLGIIPTGRRPTITNPIPNDTIINLPIPNCGEDPKRLCISDLISIVEDIDEEVLTAEPDVRLFLPFGFIEYTNASVFYKRGRYHTHSGLGSTNIRSGMIANVTFTFPSMPSLFLRNTTQTDLCSTDNLPDDCEIIDNEYHCECPHVVTVKKNQIIEITWTTTNDVDHPFHLHGHEFHVVYIGQNTSKADGFTQNEVDEVLRNRASKTSNRTPALKDTVIVPHNGFTTVRFRSYNPGDWLMHCHLEWHSAVGMMMLFRVEGEITEKPPGLPTCGIFDPLVS